jgi:alpha-D-xyloside xylohydrolase
MYYTAGSAEIRNPQRFVDIYLPEGGWYDFYTEEYHQGGRFYRIPCDITRIPLFVRAGAILPVSPVMPYVDADPDALCELRVYPGADGRFTLYNDAGDGYGYEQGDYTMQRFTYDDATGTVTETSEGVDTYRRRIAYRIVGV